MRIQIPTLFAVLLAISAGLLGAPSAAWAQNAKKEIPPPETLALTTKDGVTLQATYYGSIQGKKAIPVIMMPGWERSRADVQGLALAMQKEGLAVITVDMRGHGGSKSIQLPNGNIEEIDLDRLRARDFDYFVTHDLEAVKKYLMEENNKGNLNIEMLTLIGCDYTAVAAVNYAAQDWSWPRLPAFKQGQDVKGLILVSPPKSFKGFSPTQAVNHPVVKSELSMMIIVGEDNRNDFSDAKRLYSSLEKGRARSSEERTLFFAGKPTDLSGTALLADPRANCLKDILFFCNIHLKPMQENDPWTDRTTPL